MPITPYALNVKGVDFGQSVNMLNAVRQMQAQNQQREMNALAMQKAQQDMQEANALRSALSRYDVTTPEGINAIRQTGIKGLEYASALDKASVEKQQAQAKMFEQNMKLLQKGASMMPDTPESYASLYNATVGDHPELKPFLTDPRQYVPGQTMQALAVSADELYRRQTMKLKLAGEQDIAHQHITAADARSQREIDAAAAKGIVVGPGSSLVQNGKVIYTAPKTDKASWETTTDMNGNVTAFNPATGETKSFGKIGQSKGSWVQSTDDKGNLTIVNPQTGEQKTFTGIGKTNVAPDQLQLARDKFNQQKSQDEFNRNMAERKQQFEEWKSNPETRRAVSENESYGKKMAENNVLYQQHMPEVIQQAELGINLIDKMVGETKRDEKGNIIYGQPHPGFQDAVGAGIGLRFVPGTNAANFQAYFDQVKGQTFLQAFQTLKGGGSITEKEGEKATSALNRMSLAQSETEFKEAARELQDILRTGALRAKAKLEGTGIPKGRGFTYNPKGGEQARPSLEDIFNQ